MVVKDVVSMSNATGSLVRKVDDLERSHAEEEHAQLVEACALEHRAADAEKRRGDLERLLAHQRCEAYAANQRRIREVEEEGLEAIARAERRLRAEEQLLAQAERTLAVAEWRRDRARQQADIFEGHAMRMRTLAEAGLEEAKAGGRRRIERSRAEGLERAQRAEDARAAETPRLAAVAALAAARATSASDARARASLAAAMRPGSAQRPLTG
mmetsp:Transcript_121259/g.258803  ORF Transcript_121259/g.258803 Transcript_121259/m.258803 type:complete len:213 (-) Transcript_121259:57-695(-)